MAERSGSGAIPAVTVAALALLGCGGGAVEDAAPWYDDVAPGSDIPESEAAAARFLERATFGPKAEEIEALMTVGYSAWLDHQTALAPSLHRPALEALAASGSNVFQNQRQEQWFARAVNGSDQLRQRMAYSLSQIFVISDRASALQNEIMGVTEHYDVLVRGALGNYRDLLEEVTKSPAMGRYLSHLKNEKGDPLANIRPDENFAREVMQLFSIGLVELELDGSVRLDGDGQPIPTYGQEEIEAMARVMTGWNFAGATSWNWPQEAWEPMEAWEEFHDNDAKTILGGAFLPAMQTAEQDLDAALDALFEHPNTPPFIAKQLIQRLVTSNPSPSYVTRVALTFIDDGEGERGDLAAVARAILLDPEALDGHIDDPAHFGKLREPLVRMVGLWRAFDAGALSGNFRVWNPEKDFGQAALRADSVFNFYAPDFAPLGPLDDAGLTGPEFQIATHSLITSTSNRYHRQIYRAWPGWPSTSSDTITLDLTDELALADDPGALVDHLDLLLMAGQMSGAMRSVLVGHVGSVDLDAGNKPEGMQRVLDAIYLIMTSPEGMVQL